MRKYRSIKEARKTLILQASVLTAAVLLFVLCGRLLTHNRFTALYVLSYLETGGSPASPELTFEQKGEAPLDISGYEILDASGNALHMAAVSVTLQPEKEGEYELVIRDAEGNERGRDNIYVDRFLTAYSYTTGGFTGDETAVLAILLLYLGMGVIMLIHFLRLKGSLAYSYEALLGCAVFLFSAVLLLIEGPIYVRHLTDPIYYPTAAMLSDLAASGKLFMMVTLIPLIGFSLLLIISNIELLRHERPRFQNILGLLLGVLLIAAELLFMWEQVTVTGSERALRLVITAENIFGIAFTYFECILISSVICGLLAARHKPEPDRDYILILGCGFRKDGTLPPLLKGRVDRAMEFWHRQKEETGREAVIIPSGGQGPNEPMPEAEAMYRYMISTGFPESAVVREDRSVNTLQNMQFSKKLIEEHAEDPSKVRTAFVTTNYHVFRSGILAGQAGLEAEGIGSRTKWWFWPNAFIRECVGMIRYKLVPELISLLILAAVFGAWTYLSLL